MLNHLLFCSGLSFQTWRDSTSASGPFWLLLETSLIFILYVWYLKSNDNWVETWPDWSHRSGKKNHIKSFLWKTSLFLILLTPCLMSTQKQTIATVRVWCWRKQQKSWLCVCGRSQAWPGYKSTQTNGQRSASVRRLSARRSLLVELVLLLVLLDDRLIRFLKVFGEDDVPVLAYGQHAGLRRGETDEPEPSEGLKASNALSVGSPPGRWSWCRLQRSYRVGRRLRSS